MAARSGLSLAERAWYAEQADSTEDIERKVAAWRRSGRSPLFEVTVRDTEELQDLDRLVAEEAERVGLSRSTIDETLLRVCDAKGREGPMDGLGDEGLPCVCRYWGESPHVTCDEVQHATKTPLVARALAPVSGETRYSPLVSVDCEEGGKVAASGARPSYDDVLAFDMFSQMDLEGHMEVRATYFRAFALELARSTDDEVRDRVGRLLAHLDMQSAASAARKDAFTRRSFLEQSAEWNHLGLGIASDFASYATSMRYPWGCRCLCDSIAGFWRRKQLKQTLTKLESGAMKRKTALPVALDIFGEVSGLIDLYTDVKLARYLIQATGQCLHNGALPGCRSHGVAIASIALSLSIASPYLIAYSSGIQTLLQRGVFDAHRTCAWRLVSVAYLTCFGPLYFVLIDVFMALESIVWGPVSLLLSTGCYSKGEGFVEGVFQAVGMSKMDLEGYKRQRSMAQLAFETVPQLILQSLVFAGVLHTGNLMASAGRTIAISICMSFVNLFMQVFKLRVESHGLGEVISTYAFECMQARSGWVPFVDLMTSVGGMRVVSEAGVDLPRPLRAIDFGNIRCRVPMATEWAGVWIDLEFNFTGMSIATLTDRLSLEPPAFETYTGQRIPGKHIELGDAADLVEVQRRCAREGRGAVLVEGGKAFLVPLSAEVCRRSLEAAAGCTTYINRCGCGEDAGASRSVEADAKPTLPLRRVRLGHSCRAVTAAEVLQLIAASRFRVDLDFKGVDWAQAVENMRWRGELQLSNEKWLAWLPDGTPLLKHCLFTEIPGSLQSCRREEQCLEGESFHLGAVAHKLLEARADPDIVDNHGQGSILLTICASGGRWRSVQMLLSCRASPNHKAAGRTPLGEAIRQADRDTIRLLLGHPSIDLDLTARPAEHGTRELSPVGVAVLHRRKMGPYVHVLEDLIERKLIVQSSEYDILIETALTLTRFNADEKDQTGGIERVGPPRLHEWRDQQGRGLLHHAALGACRHHPLHEGYWLHLQRFLLRLATESELVENARGGDTHLVVVALKYFRMDAEDKGNFGANCLLGWLWESVARPSDMSLVWEALADTYVGIAASSSSWWEEHGEPKGPAHVLHGIFRNVEAIGMATKKAEARRDVDACRRLAELAEPSKRATKEGQEDRPQGQASDRHDAATTSATGDAEVSGRTSDTMSAARAFQCAEVPPESRDRAGWCLQLIVDASTCALETISAADLATDISILCVIFLNNHVYWSTITIVSMCAPYLVSYAATLRLMLRNRTFEDTDLHGRRLRCACLRRLAGVCYLTPLSLCYFLLVDIVYALKSATLDVLALLLRIVSCGRVCGSRGAGESDVDCFCSGVLGMTRMDAEGYRRMRTMSQLIFEACIQIPLQSRILMMPAYAEQMGLSRPQVVASVVFAGFHFAMSIATTALEAMACRDRLLRYAATCLAGRFCWVPFLAELNNAGRGGDGPRSFDFGDIGCDLGVLGRFEVHYEFSPATLRVLMEAVQRLPTEVQEERRPRVAFGRSASLLRLEDLLELHRASRMRASLEWGEVCWQRVLAASACLEWAKKHQELDSSSGANHDVLTEFVTLGDATVVLALLGAGLSPSGLSKAGELLLTEAVLRRSVALCGHLLDYGCPLMAEGDFAVRNPVHVAINLGDLDVLECVLVHPRVKVIPRWRSRLLEMAFIEFDQISSESMEPSEKARIRTRAQRFVFLAGGVAATSSADCVTNGADVRALATKASHSAALEWLSATAAARQSHVDVKLAEGVVSAAADDLERFSLLRQKLSSRARAPLGCRPSDDEDAPALVEWGGERPLVDLRRVQELFPALTKEAFEHLLELVGAQGTEPPLARAGLVDAMDRLCEGLGLGHGMGAYLRATGGMRLRRSIVAEQRASVEVAANDTREACVAPCVEERGAQGPWVRLLEEPIKLPPDCWRVTSMTVEGLWLDQGFGGTNSSCVELHVRSEAVGHLRSHVHVINREDPSYDDTGGSGVNAVLEWRFDRTNDLEVNSFGRSCLEVLTAGDEVQLVLVSAPWPAWTAKARGTKVVIEYATRNLAQ